MIVDLNPAKWFGRKPAVAVSGLGLSSTAKAETAEAGETMMKGFLDKLKAAIVSMWHKAPAIAVWIASAINALVPVIEELDVIVDPADAAIINPILDRIKVGLTALKVTIQDAGQKANAATIVASVSTHLDALESASGIKNADTKKKIADVAAVVKAELATIGGVLPAA